MTIADQQRPAAAPSRPARAARITTEIFAPAVLIVVLFLAVGWHADR